jgi:membrane protease YdiL (CAAX protease family)
LPYILVLIYLGVTIYAANQVQNGLWQPIVLRVLLYTATGAMFLLALFPLQIALLSNTGLTVNPSADPEVAIPEISLTTALAAGVAGLLLASFNVAVLSSYMLRTRLAGLLNRSGTSYFDPESPVHLTAWMLCSLVAFGVVFLFIVSGGITAVAESVAVEGFDAFDTVITAILELIAAGLGVGYALRRDGAQTLQRLGLRIPTREDISRGALIGIAMIFAQIIFIQVIQTVLNPDSFQEQSEAAQQITLAVSTLPMLLILSVCAAVGEETLIRGALQPVLGIIVSSIFFTLLHSQYLGTPFMLLIFGVSLAFAWLRQRFSTTASIIAHFTYNFIPLFLLLLATATGGVSN